MRALVLGGGGFIGSHLVDVLLETGQSVRVLDRSVEKQRVTPEAVDYVIGDYADVTDLAEALQDVDVVYHLASSTVPSTSNLDAVSDVQSNLVPSVRLLEQMVRLEVPRLVYLSSGGTVYGNAGKTAVTVAHELGPLCSYGVVKLAVEHYIGMFRELYGLSAVVLRPSNPYGPRQGHLGVQGAVATFLDCAASNATIRIWGDGHHMRDYLYVQDLARLCAMVGASGHQGTYNAGSGLGLSLNDVLEAIKEVTGRDLDVVYRPPRSVDVDAIILDTTETHSTFGWQAEVEFRDGLRRHWDWMTTRSDTVVPG